MPRFAYLIMAVIAISFVSIVNAEVDDQEDVYDQKVPPGMELQQLGNKPGVTAVLPKGTSIRREGDLRVLEGSGEYAARKFVKYDAILDRMNAEISSLRKDVEELKNIIAGMRQKKLVSG
jgi:hypothetical protein